MTRTNSSRPRLSVPDQCLPLGPFRESRTLPSSWKLYLEMALTRTTMSVMSTRMIALTMASLWRLNRRHASCLVVRTFSSTRAGSPTGSRTPGPPAVGSTSPPTSSVAGGPPPPASSGIADPRVEEGVGDVGEQVEQDDEGYGDHDPRQHLRIVTVGEGGDEELAHARPLEDLLGDDEAPGQGADVQGQLGGDGDEGVAHG